MTRSGYLFTACLAVAFANAVPATAAESIVLAQDLKQVKQSDSVIEALWTRRPDSYTLQLVIPKQPVFTKTGDRDSIFVGRTIANLRGLDPSFGTRTLTIADETGKLSAQPAAQKAEVAPPRGPPQIQVWLLRTDGTQIPASWRSVDPVPNKACSLRCIADEIMYRFPLVDGAQAVAVAVRVDENFYIEKLQSLEPKPATP